MGFLVFHTVLHSLQEIKWLVNYLKEYVYIMHGNRVCSSVSINSRLDIAAEPRPSKHPLWEQWQEWPESAGGVTSYIPTPTPAGVCCCQMPPPVSGEAFCGGYSLQSLF